MEKPAERDANLELTPEQGLPFELEENAVSEWLSELPVDVNRACSLVYKALRGFNKVPCNSCLGLNILEIFRPIVYFLSGKLRNQFSGSGFPLDRIPRKTAKLSVKFHMELAKGYGQLSKSSAFEADFGESERALIIHRAIQSLSLAILGATQMYEPFSSRIWGDLNRLYRSAEEKGLTSTVIDDEQYPLGAKSSIASIYNRTALFAFINPYRFNRGEMFDIFRLLERVSDDAYLSPEMEKQDLRAACYIDIKGNLPPATITQDIPCGIPRYFFTQKLVNTLIRLNKAEVTRPGSSNFIPNVIQYFEQSTDFGLPGERKRNHLIQGFDPVFSFVCTSKSMLGLIHEISLKDKNWIKTPDYELLPIDDGQSPHNSQSQSRQDASGSPVASDYLDDTDDASGVTGEGISCYISALDTEGFYLIETDAVLDPSEIIAFWSKDESLKIGGIRWQKITGQSNHYQYGFELLGSHVCPATLSVKENEQTKVLLMKSTWNDERQESILLPPIKFPCGTLFKAVKGRKTLSYKITKLREMNNRFCRFSVVATGE